MPRRWQRLSSEQLCLSHQVQWHFTGSVLAMQHATHGSQWTHPGPMDTLRDDRHTQVKWTHSGPMNTSRSYGDTQALGTHSGTMNTGTMDTLTPYGHTQALWTHSGPMGLNRACSVSGDICRFEGRRSDPFREKTLPATISDVPRAAFSKCWPVNRQAMGYRTKHRKKP